MTQTPNAGPRQTGDTLLQVAARTGFSEDAVGVMAAALRAGGGSMAQFNHPEFGGFGQGSSGGMLMIGDMFNEGLKARVRDLMDALIKARNAGLLPEPEAGEAGSFKGTIGGAWWPEGLGRPSSTGAQNGRRYAVFPESRRLAIETDGKVTLYDTADHRIGGVSQAQGGTASLRLSSDRGDVDLEKLAIVDKTATAAPAEPPLHPEAADPVSDKPSPAPRQEPEPAPAVSTVSVSGTRESGAPEKGDTIATIRHLAALREDGILTDDEFTAKKQELLARL